MGSGLFVAPQYLDNRKRLDERKTPLVATIAELYGAADLRKQGIVLADAHIQPGLDRCPTLPHDDRTSGYYLAAERLHAQPLSIRVPSIC